MTNTKIYAEEQIINQKIKIPTNFVELGPVKKYWGSTEGLDKSLCERYAFKYDNKSITLDITQELTKKLGLEENKSYFFSVYINRDMLTKKPEEDGITIDNEKDIIFQTKEIILVQEKATQIDFTSGEITDLKQKLKKSEELSQETQQLLERVLKDNEEKHIAIIFFKKEIKDLIQRITESRCDLENEIVGRKKEESKNQELERIIKKLKEDEQVLIGLENRISDMQKELGNQIIALTVERDKIQQELDNLKIKLESKLKRVKNAFLNSLFLGISKSSKKSKEIKGLKVQRVRLRKELIDKDQRIENLNNQVSQLTTQINNLNGTVRNRDQTITNLRTNLASENNARTRAESEASRLNGENSNLRSQLQSVKNEKNNYYNQVQNLNCQVSSLSSQLNSARYETNKSSLQEQVNSLQSRVSFWNNKFRNLRHHCQESHYSCKGCKFLTHR